MSNKAYFSPSKLIFIPFEWGPVDSGGDGTWSVEKMPLDIVLLDEEQYSAYWKVSPPEGKILGSENGLPVWVDPPTLPASVLYEQELNEINSSYDKDVSDLVLKYSRAGLFDGTTEAVKKAEIYASLQERKTKYTNDINELDSKYGD